MRNEKSPSSTDSMRQELAAKGVQPIDIGAERKKPVFTSVEQFVDRIKQYSIPDYYNTEKPYWDLVEVSRAQVGLFDQYAAAMLAHIRKKVGLPERETDVSQVQTHQKTNKERIVEHVAGEIELYKYIHILGCNETNSIVRYIKEVEKDNDTADKVSVLPLVCGSGKSTAITLLIKETIERIEKAKAFMMLMSKKAEEMDGMLDDEAFEREYGFMFDGLLIVTDSKERLKKIWKPDKKNKYITEEDRQFIEKHNNTDWIVTITDDNVMPAERDQRYAPVFCLTTQRFFQWEREQIEDHLTWGVGKQKHKRPLIVFDEQPYLNEVRDISVKTINDIDTALRMYLDEETIKSEKLWCCNQWDAFRNRFFALLQHYEYDFPGLDTLFYRPEEHSLTDDDEKFFDIIERNRKKIRAKNHDAYNDLKTVRKFMNSWGIFNHRDANPTNERTPKGEYWNKFSVFIDNRDKIEGLDAKVVVLDGTGDVSPIYKGQDYVHIHDGMSFLRSLSYLNIVLCDFPTSKQDFANNGYEITKAVKQYLKEQGHEQKDVIFFTYKGKESKFQAKVNGKAVNNVAHFGDIKGKNEFTDKTCFAQVGLYRLQPVQYLAHLLGRNRELLDDVASREPQRMYERIQEIYQDERFLDFMYSHILADIDQCLFRSAIRNSDNLKPVTYYLFFKQTTYPQLQAKIEERYQSKLGANILNIAEQTIWNISKAGAVADLVRSRLIDWDGTPIKIGDFLAAIEVNYDSYYTAYRRSKKARTCFSKMIDGYMENAKKLGKPGGWIAKNRS